MVHILTNQPFEKKYFFLGASKKKKFMDMPFAISPLSKNFFSVSLPPKNCKIFGSIYFPSIFDFQVVLMLNQLWLYRFIPHSFLMTMQGWWRIFLSFRISEFKYLRKKLSRPLLLISTFITVRRKYHKLFHSPSHYPIGRI